MKNQDKHTGDLMTFKEVQLYFKKGSSTIERWVKGGVLKKYGVAGSVYFKYDEVKSLLKPLN